MAGERFNLAELEARVIERTVGPIDNFKPDVTVVGPAIGKQVVVWTVFKPKARLATVGANCVEYVIVGDVADQKACFAVSNVNVAQAAQADLTPVNTDPTRIGLSGVVHSQVFDEAIQGASADVVTIHSVLRANDCLIRQVCPDARGEPIRSHEIDIAEDY
jgi:hypothetical protein